MFNKQHERAIAAMERAVALGPDDADAYASLAVVLMLAGRPEEAIELVKKAMRLNPYHPPHYLSWLGQAYRLTGQYEEAISPLEKAITLNPNFLFDHINLAAIYSELGREEEARTEAAEVLRISPNLSLEGLRQSLPYKDPVVLERFLTALHKAGLK